MREAAIALTLAYIAAVFASCSIRAIAVVETEDAVYGSLQFGKEQKELYEPTPTPVMQDLLPPDRPSNSIFNSYFRLRGR